MEPDGSPKEVPAGMSIRRMQWGPPTRNRVAVLATAVAFATVVAAPASSTAWPSIVPSRLVRAAERLGMTCSNVTSKDGISYTRCSGEIPSFDGVGIDTDLSLPLGADHALPTLLMLHGWGGDKTAWEADTIHGASADTNRWNNVWFASR